MMKTKNLLLQEWWWRMKILNTRRRRKIQLMNMWDLNARHIEKKIPKVYC
jgi:hypothetical protein